MPVQINEMEITVTVIPDPPSDRSSTTSPGVAEESSKRRMLEQCLEQMMEVINNKNER